MTIRFEDRFGDIHTVTKNRWMVDYTNNKHYTVQHRRMETSDIHINIDIELYVPHHLQNMVKVLLGYTTTNLQRKIYEAL